MMPRVDPGESNKRKGFPAAAGHPPAAVPPTALKVAAVSQMSHPFTAQDAVPIKVEQVEKPALNDQEMADEEQDELYVDATWIRKQLYAQVQDDDHLVDGDLLSQLPNGSKLECSCKNGFPDGKAVITNSKDGKIDLTFSKGKPHGEALQTFQDGRTIKFTFKNGRREGEAIEKLPNGQTNMFLYRKGKRKNI
ncbi:MAG: hypothetical protein LLG04_03630 [Parachlamydia sp.]|nr:hypothetical protein [Parachlamydia sp.]